MGSCWVVHGLQIPGDGILHSTNVGMCKVFDCLPLVMICWKLRYRYVAVNPHLYP